MPGRDGGMQQGRGEGGHLEGRRGRRARRAGAEDGRYIFISSISVYKSFAVAGMDETAPVETIDDPTNEDVKANYGALKALREQAAERAMPGRVTNVHAGLIIGPDDPTGRFTHWSSRLAQGGESARARRREHDRAVHRRPRPRGVARQGRRGPHDGRLQRARPEGPDHDEAGRRRL
jgi:hypothetical protein